MSVPAVLRAQALKDEILIVANIFDSAISLIMVVALLAFIWGAIRFIGTAGDDKSRAAGRQLMVWGTVALFLMVSVWGIVRIIKTTFFGV